MRYLIPLCLLVAACNAPTPAAPAQKPKESRIVLLKYRSDFEKSDEEKRLNKLIQDEGWRIVSTETRSQEIRVNPGDTTLRDIPGLEKAGAFAEWNVTVTLEREKP